LGLVSLVSLIDLVSHKVMVWVARCESRTEGGVRGQQLAAQARHAGALHATGFRLQGGQRGRGAVKAGQGGRVLTQQRVAARQMKQRLCRPPALV
jgi:hypothetical protein